MTHAMIARNIASGLPRQVAVVGAASLIKSGLNSKKKIGISSSLSSKIPSTTTMIRKVMEGALKQAKLSWSDLDGLVAVPSLTGNNFMEAHYQATALGMFGTRHEERPLRCRTIDTGGAGPISALLEAERMIQSEGLECVAVIAADAVGSWSSEEFLSKADDIFFKLSAELGLPEGSVQSPAIPHGYDRITQHQMDRHGLRREQLQMAVTLESFHASLHPKSLQSQRSMQNNQQEHQNETNFSKDGTTRVYSPYTSLKKVQSAPSIAPNISLLECARRADGAACLILASNRFLQRRNLWAPGIPVVIGGGAFAGPLYPPQDPKEITDTLYASCRQAMERAYASAGNLTANDIHFFGLYDCFPICLVRAIEACGLASPGEGGTYLQGQYERLLDAIEQDRQKTSGGSSDTLKIGKAVEALISDPKFFPINTHGGLLCFGAPWEVPAMYNVVEAVEQLRGQAKGRQIPDARRSLVFGNGGVLSASAVAILATS
jgi:acetyl-CoA acetyltransferase